jgi:hypothetical protein
MLFMINWANYEYFEFINDELVESSASGVQYLRSTARHAIHLQFDITWNKSGTKSKEDHDGPVVSVRSRKLSNVDQSLDGWPKMYYLEFLRAAEGKLSSWFSPYWVRVVAYCPFSLSVIHKEGLCSSRDIDWLMLMMMKTKSKIHSLLCCWLYQEVFYLRNKNWIEWRVYMWGTRGLNEAKEKEKIMNHLHETRRQIQWNNKNILRIQRALLIRSKLTIFGRPTWETSSDYKHTYIPLTLYPRRGSRSVADIPSKRARFTKIILLCHVWSIFSRDDRW